MLSIDFDACPENDNDSRYHPIASPLKWNDPSASLNIVKTDAESDTDFRVTVTPCIDFECSSERMFPLSSPALAMDAVCALTERETKTRYAMSGNDLNESGCLVKINKSRKVHTQDRAISLALTGFHTKTFASLQFFYMQGGALAKNNPHTIAKTLTEPALVARN